MKQFIQKIKNLLNKFESTFVITTRGTFIYIYVRVYVTKSTLNINVLNIIYTVNRLEFIRE